MKLRFGFSVIFFLLLLAGCSGNSTDPGPGPITREGLPDGFIYFLTTSPAQVYRYDIQNDRLLAVVDSSRAPRSFSISNNGRMLFYRRGDSLVGRIDLVSSVEEMFSAPFPLNDDISANNTGNSCALTGFDSEGSFIVRLLAEEGVFIEFTPHHERHHRSPLYSRGGTILAWLQDDGLYARFLTNNAEFHLSPQLAPPSDFSPLGGRLASQGQVFDLNTMTPKPLMFNGAAKFLSEDFLLYLTDDTHTIFLANVNGTSNEALTGPLTPGARFAPSPDQRFIAWFTEKALGYRLTVFKLDEKKAAAVVDFALGGGNQIRQATWVERVQLP